jgi:glycerol-3-phosphate acyltransferase PlsY
MYAHFALLTAAAYLLGSIPFGLLIAKAHGKDLRSIGSGNIGATNVSRALGRKWAYFCFALDVLKGLTPTLAAMYLVRTSNPQSNREIVIILWLWLAVGCAAVVGHIFPIYIRFKGGKGVATSFGVALGIWPYYTLCALLALVVWAVVLMIWRYVSLASLVASIAFPLGLFIALLTVPQWSIASLWPLLIVATVIPVMVTIRHRPNIKRLLQGTESKAFQQRSEAAHNP